MARHRNLPGTRSSRRQSTKSAMHKAAQHGTKRALRLGRKVHDGTGRAKRGPVTLPTWRVRNKGTKREVTVQAVDIATAFDVAMSEHRLAKSVEKLTAEPV